MLDYALHEGIISLPEDWLDQSINIFVHPGGDPPQCTVVLSRGILESGEDLKGYAQRQTDLLKQTLTDMEIIREQDILIQRQQGWEAEFGWSGEGRRYRQRQVFLARGTLVVIFTATVQEDFYVKHWQAMDAILGSFRFKDSNLKENTHV
ncbi:MAG: DcrB-related protein [Geobacteraceae bacterium]|nr:DcrB-related protein [Geobacteraceae bacterium]